MLATIRQLNFKKGFKMSNISEEFKDEKINQILEDYIALDNQINGVFSTIKQAMNDIPAQLSEAVSGLPAQLDNKLQERIDAIGSIAQKLDDEVQREATRLTGKIRDEAEQTGNAVINKLHAAINDDIGEGLKRINAAANIVEGVSKDAGSTKYVIMTALVCSLFSFIAGFAGVTTWNVVYLDAANKKAANFERIIAKQDHAKDALLAALPKAQAEKASKIYDDFINNK